MQKLVTLLLMSLALVASSCLGGPVVINDFESGNMDQWIVEGNAFLMCPKNVTDYPEVVGAKGRFFAGSDGDGQMTSVSFTIKRDYINFLLGSVSDELSRRFSSVELLVDGAPVRVSHPRQGDDNHLEWCSWDVKSLKGLNANIRVKVDPVPSNHTLKSRPILVDHFTQSGRKMSSFNDTLTVNIVVTEDWLLIPSSNNGSVSSMSILCDGNNILGVPQLVNLAGDHQDYAIPVNVSAYKGCLLKLRLTDVDDSDLSVTGLSQRADRGFVYDEPYRQIYHFTPDFGWTNDPNGMVYFDGEYHLAYQANPYGTKHYNMHWGNAVSTDLMHWQDLPFIVAPDSLGAIYSGSAVVDADGSAGFGVNAIVGMYTSASDTQKQSIAYSTDRGRTYTKYEGNPVLCDDQKQPDFRDPKIIRYKDHWIVCVAAGEVIAFYKSQNLKDWTKLSEFGKGIGSHAAVWECPDLFPLEYKGQKKWVLIVNINPGGPNGGSVAQYFIGNFDGTSFRADPLPYPLWIDEGTDNYAGVTFSNTGDRHIFMGWMSNWFYSNEVPTINFRNSMTLPRDLFLKHNGKHLFLASVPSEEVYAARCNGREVEVPALKEGFLLDGIIPDNRGAYEIDFTVTPGSGRNLVFRLGNDAGEEMVYTFDFGALTLNLDRSRSGKTEFYKDFGKSDILTHLLQRPSYPVKVFVDRQSVEMFVGDGDVSFTCSMFPTRVYDRLVFDSSDCAVSDMNVYEIK